MTLAYLPTAGGKALVSATVTHSSLSASLPLSWWGRKQSRAKRITSGRLRSQAACVSEAAAAGSPLRGRARFLAGPGSRPGPPCPVCPQRHSGWFLPILRTLLAGSSWLVVLETAALRTIALDLGASSTILLPFPVILKSKAETRGHDPQGSDPVISSSPLFPRLTPLNQVGLEGLARL